MFHRHAWRETASEKGRRILQEELDKLGWQEEDLLRRAKGDARKMAMARRLRKETSVTLKWIAKELRMGSWTYVNRQLNRAKGNHESINQDELGLV